jgi:hypothetical protein
MQNLSTCTLWPMHRGYGYLQNYLDGRGMRSLEEDIVKTYVREIDEEHEC